MSAARKKPGPTNRTPYISDYHLRWLDRGIRVGERGYPMGLGWSDFVKILPAPSAGH